MHIYACAQVCANSRVHHSATKLPPVGADMAGCNLSLKIILLFIAELDVRSKLVTQRALAPTKHFGDERIASPTSEALLAT